MLNGFRLPQSLVRDWLFSLCSAHGLTVVALLCGVSYSAVGQWRRGITRPGRAASWQLWTLSQMTAAQREALLMARIRAAVEEGVYEPRLSR